MIVCVPLTATGEVDPRWGRAARVAVATLAGGEITDWQEFDVRWDELHDVGPEGGHHARVARFLIDHGVQAIVANHVGPGMVQMLDRMAIRLHVGAVGNARAAVGALGPAGTGRVQ